MTIKERNPDARVFILYRDMMTYGQTEKYYTEARRKGIIFVNYSMDNKPEVGLEDGKPVVTFKETILDAEIEITADCLVLAPMRALETTSCITSFPWTTKTTRGVPTITPLDRPTRLVDTVRAVETSTPTEKSIREISSGEQARDNAS